MLAGDGRVIEGVNVENAAYPLGVCGADGTRAGDRRGLPAGRLRRGGDHRLSLRRLQQWLHELGVARVVFRNGGRVVTMGPDELLPESFDSSNLSEPTS